MFFFLKFFIVSYSCQGFTGPPKPKLKWNLSATILKYIIKKIGLFTTPTIKKKFQGPHPLALQPQLHSMFILKIYIIFKATKHKNSILYTTSYTQGFRIRFQGFRFRVKGSFLTNNLDVIQGEKGHGRIGGDGTVLVEDRLGVLRSTAGQGKRVRLVRADLVLDAADAGFGPDANVVPEEIRSNVNSNVENINAKNERGIMLISPQGQGKAPGATQGQSMVREPLRVLGWLG